MRLKVFRCYTILYNIVSKCKNHLPLVVNRILHSPISQFMREYSPSEDLENFKKPLLEGVENYCIESSILEKTNSFPRVIHRSRKDHIVLLNNVEITCSGIIISERTISRFSSIYRRLTLNLIFKSANDFFSKLNRVKIESAIFIPRQFIDQGTWGDYIIEFLLPLSCVDIKNRRPILLDADFIKKYAPNDLNKLGLNYLEIPKSGFSIKELQIITPCQSFDNFERDNIRNLQNLFPVKRNSISVKTQRVYLSRLGHLNSKNKNSRVLKNELEVEIFLSNRGFQILKAHELPNDILRERLSNADVVVGGWGSAFINALWGNPSIIIEIAHDSVWGPACIKMGIAMGVPNYIVLKTNKDSCISIAKVKDTLDKHNIL